MKPFSFFFPAFVLLISLFFVTAVFSLAAGEQRVKILFLGDSLSAGLGVEPEDAYPALVQARLKEKGFHQVEITNASITGSTTASALSRLKWFLKVKPDILVLALGANDGLRGLSTTAMARNLDDTILLAKNHGIRVILAGMKLPPNYGPDYARAFEDAFVFLADQHKIPFIPFLLKDVAGKAWLNQTDGIHPNREGHRIIAGTVLACILEQL